MIKTDREVSVAQDTERPSPANFTDFREYLRTMISWLRQNQRGFSFRWFARRAGHASPSFLKLVAEGKRNLSLSSISSFGKALGHTRHSQEVFENLVLLGQAKTDPDRNKYFIRLRKLTGPRSPVEQLSGAQYDVYSYWYIIPVRELMLHKNFQEDPEWIARRLQPRIKPTEAAKALDLLEQVGLAQRDESGRLRPTSVKIASQSGPVGPLAARNYHRAMLGLCSDKLDTLPVHKRNVTSLTISMDSQQYEEVCERVTAFRRELLDLIEDSKSSDGRDVYLLGFQIFPLSGEEN